MKEEKNIVIELEKIGSEFGFNVKCNVTLENGHYYPDFISKKDSKLIGFEVEYFEKGSSNKKFIGDAYWSNKTTYLGVIVFRGKKKSLSELLEYLKKKYDFNKVFLIDVKT